MRPLGLVLLAALTALASCGWRAGLPRPNGAETLGVEFPANDSKLRDLEIDLAQALAEAALDRVSLKPVAPGSADLVMRGRIVDFRRIGGIRRPENDLAESRDTIRLELQLMDRRTGRVLGDTSRAIGAGFVVEADEAATIARDERAAQLRAARNLAELLILELFDPLAYETDDARAAR